MVSDTIFVQSTVASVRFIMNPPQLITTNQDFNSEFNPVIQILDENG